jgi:hypothetical protein
MRTVRVSRLGILAAALAAASTGCSTMNNTEKGALGGGAVGAGVGALAGGGKGALIGGLIGAGTGGVVGAVADDRQDARQTKAAVAQANAAAAQAQQAKLGMMDVVHMVQQGHAPEVIITQIRNTGSSFQLSPTDLDYLKTCNVPDQVIVAMQNARPVSYVAAPRRVYVQDDPQVIYTRPAPVYVYGPPPPAGVVFVGGRWR